MPTGPVTHGKAWIEMVHRYLATGGRRADPDAGRCDLGRALAGAGASTAPAAAASRTSGCRARCLVADRHPGLGLPAGRVRRAHRDVKLFPAIVTLHLLGGHGAAGAAVHPGGALPAGAVRSATAARCRRGLRTLLWSYRRPAAAADRAGRLGQHQLRGAGLHAFPTCQGSWWPRDEFPAGLRALARTRPERRAASTSSSRRSPPSTTCTA